MNVINTVKEYFRNSLKGLKRFWGAGISVIICFVLSTIFVIDDFQNDDFIYFLIGTSFSFILCLLLKLISEKSGKGLVFELVSGVLCIVSFLPIGYLLKVLIEHSEEKILYIIAGFCGAEVILILALLALLIDNEKCDSLPLHFVKTSFTAMIVAQIVMAGLLICLTAFTFLITDIPDFDKALIIICLFCTEVLFLGIFISQIPSNESNLSPTKVFKYIILYAMLPVYALLLLVLYGYIIKIIFTWSMPGGQINWFASFAELFFIFFSSVIYCFDSKIVTFFRRFGGYFLLPIVATQAVAIYIRVSAYGLTAARIMSISLSVWALVFIVLSLIKEGKYRFKSLYVLIAIVALLTLTPANMFDIAGFEQTIRIENVLNKNNMLDGENVIANSNISNEDKLTIISCYDYLSDSNYGNAPSYVLQNGESTDEYFIKTFGFSRSADIITDADENSYYTVNVYAELKNYRENDKLELNIENYKSICEIPEYDAIYREEERIYISTSEGQLDITDALLDLAEKENNDIQISEKDFIIEGNKSDIVVLSASYMVNYYGDGNAKIIFYYIDAYEFIK